MSDTLGFQDLFLLSMELPSHLYNNRRQAIYFPSTAELDVSRALNTTEEDDASTWEFKAPAAALSRVSSSTSSSDTACHSPAQEIVYRYRAGLKVDLAECESQPHDLHSPKSIASDASTINSNGSDDSSLGVPRRLADESDVQARFRQSRVDALLDIVRTTSLVGLS